MIHTPSSDSAWRHSFVPPESSSNKCISIATHHSDRIRIDPILGTSARRNRLSLSPLTPNGSICCIGVDNLIIAIVAVNQANGCFVYPYYVIGRKYPIYPWNPIWNPLQQPYAEAFNHPDGEIISPAGDATLHPPPRIME